MGAKCSASHTYMTIVFISEKSIIFIRRCKTESGAAIFFLHDIYTWLTKLAKEIHPNSRASGRSLLSYSEMANSPICLIVCSALGKANNSGTVYFLGSIAKAPAKPL